MANVHKFVATPVGRLTLVATEKGLAAVLWQDDRAGRVRIERGAEDKDNRYLLEAEKQLGEYFAGSRRKFTVPLDFSTGTPFQQKVWDALCRIPHGETRSYGEVAKQIGSPRANRAVGAANGRNPVSIIAACHRVIGADGSMTGFAGGLKVKEFLLGLEKPAPARR